MISFEHDHDHHDLMQFFLSPEQHNTTLMPEPEQANQDVSRKRKSPDLDSGKNVEEHKTLKDYEKRINHRDALRKRRQEMAILYTSLRSTLPKEYVQQRKSICNDMHGAVNYINHLKQEIGALAKKRNDLKKLVDVGSSFSFDHEKTSIKVECSKTGVEVILKTSSTKGYPLSKFLSVLNDEGMPVVSCTSTRANEALIHVVYCEMDAQGSFDQTELEKRLGGLVHYNL